MTAKSILYSTILALFIGLGIVVTSAAPADKKAGADKKAAADKKEGADKKDEKKKEGGKGAKEKIWVRMTPFGEAFKQGYHVEGHRPEDLLKLISELKPDVLDRFVTGLPNPNMPIPTSPPTTYAKYLTAAMHAGAPGCTLTPKVHLNDIWKDEYRMNAAQALRNLPVEPRLTMLDLDCYFSGGGGEEHKHVLEKFRKMGWTDLGFNFAGGHRKTYGMASYAMAAINPANGEVATAGLAAMKSEKIKIHLAHIDYPRGIAEFKRHSPDKQAKILKKISKEQHKHHFIFIYPVLYSGYDSTKIKTSGGKTIFQVIKDLIEEDRK